MAVATKTAVHDGRAAPVPADPGDELVRVVHEGRIKLVRRRNLIDPAMTGQDGRS